LVLAVVRYDNRNTKIKHTVHIEEELRIDTFPEGKRRLSEPPTRIRFLLQALVDHMGRGIGSGKSCSYATLTDFI
jgi:hypothetical protein